MSSSPGGIEGQSGLPAPTDKQEQTTPSGVISVSIDSDSDQALSSPEEGPSSAKDTNTQAGATAGIQLTTGERSAPNGRLIITTRLSKNLI